MKKIQIDQSTLRHLIESEKLTQAAAAQKLGCSLAVIERRCKLWNLQTQRPGPRSGPLHPDWKGGRMMLGGYWYLWSNTHPHRTKANYVAEHRLVMEQTLGRYLLRSEVVHHVNGIPTDNRPENLAVFPTNAEHLRHELTGRIPNWSPQGWAAMLEGSRKKRNRKKSKSDDSQPPQTNSRPPTTPDNTPQQAS